MKKLIPILLFPLALSGCKIPFSGLSDDVCYSDDAQQTVTKMWKESAQSAVDLLKTKGITTTASLSKMFAASQSDESADCGAWVHIQAQSSNTNSVAETTSKFIFSANKTKDGVLYQIKGEESEPILQNLLLSVAGNMIEKTNDDTTPPPQPTPQLAAPETTTNTSIDTAANTAADTPAPDPDAIGMGDHGSDLPPENHKTPKI